MLCVTDRLSKIVKQGTHHIAVIGAGNLGKSLLTRYRRYDPQLNCLAIVKNAAPKLRLRDITTSEFGVPFRANQIILCVKPSQAEQVCKVIANSLTSETVVISAMAAITQKQLETWLGTTNVARIMPSILDNGPISVYNPYAMRLTLPTTNIINADIEEELDAATAISGCLPGFLSAIFQAMIRASWTVHGSNERMAKYLILKNVRAFAEEDLWDMHGLRELQQSVATKGGATERGIDKLEDNGRLRYLFQEMFQAADDRIQELQNKPTSKMRYDLTMAEQRAQHNKLDE